MSNNHLSIEWYRMVVEPMLKVFSSRIVVPDNYAHFYGQGGQAEKGKCPLWSDNANLHRFDFQTSC